MQGDAPAGWRLCAAAAGLFLFPPVLAIVAAVAAGGSALCQLIAGVSGFVAGAVLAAVTAGVLRRRRSRGGP